MRVLDTVLTLVAAPQCLWCHQPSAWGEPVCAACDAEFGVLVAAHPRHPVPEGLDDLWSAVPYAGNVRTWVARVKTGRSVLAARQLAQRMAWHYKPLPDDIAAQRWIVPIALPARRWISRGFNQAHILAHALAEQHGGQMRTVLTTSPWRSSLSRLNRGQRLASDHSFGLQGSASMPGPATVWIVDDVVTNGTTMQRAAAALRARWPHVRLYGITLCRTPPL